jgi:hypothetical protein
MNIAMLSDSTTFLERVSNHLNNTGLLWIGLLVLVLPVIRRYLGLKAWWTVGMAALLS